MTASPQALKPADAADKDWVAKVPPRLQPYLRLMRLDRPIGTWLLFWPCMLGLLLGAMEGDRPFAGWGDVWLTTLFALGSIVMRGAGCTYNDIVDHDIDAGVARTQGRPLPSGAVRLRDAWLFLAAQCALGLAILLQFNLFTIELGVGSLGLIAVYPFMKRITWWPQAWLGLTFNWGALMGFAAVSGAIDVSDAMLYAGLFFWTLGYDTIYAHQDKDDDALIGVKSTARLLGERSGRWTLAFYTIAFTLVLAAGFSEHAGWPFAFLMLLAGAHLLWQVKRLDVSSPERCLELFRANRDAGALMAVAYLLAGWLS
ncbi:MAG: 4-hydroxybenzoate octaprenyltransferase [Alphaproteobacteria bacterium]|nr:4-hydroxybenzoate octaprenyltransferase [Alphaproteobacteria bacterium]MBV9692879.1 4-hydroxybenzoate octaprenyltransferase [Alphaproteobacteria bacterium]